ncbi:hypothetical protein RJT34_27897 [Clitoria ternatea]|uniref:SMAX1-like nucleotide binding domain-containing protein n=1 Tax=Clitoria ternatea TaxID=43366 RepID=A0AAN9FAA5_CLITE
MCPVTSAASSKYKDDDIRLALDTLLRRKKKNIVIVGDSVSLTEGLVGELIGRLERSEVLDELESIHFVKFQFSPVSLRYMKKDKIEMKLLELKKKVDSIASGERGGIFYVRYLK